MGVPFPGWHTQRKMPAELEWVVYVFLIRRPNWIKVFSAAESILKYARDPLSATQHQACQANTHNCASAVSVWMNLDLNRQANISGPFTCVKPWRSTISAWKSRLHNVTLLSALLLAMALPETSKGQHLAQHHSQEPQSTPLIYHY